MSDSNNRRWHRLLEQEALDLRRTRIQLHQSQQPPLPLHPPFLNRYPALLEKSTHVFRPDFVPVAEHLQHERHLRTRDLHLQALELEILVRGLLDLEAFLAQRHEILHRDVPVRAAAVNQILNQVRLRGAVVALAVVVPREGDVVFDDVVEGQLVQVETVDVLAGFLVVLPHAEDGEDDGRRVGQDFPPGRFGARLVFRVVLEVDGPGEDPAADIAEAVLFQPIHDLVVVDKTAVAGDEAMVAEGILFASHGLVGRLLETLRRSKG